MSKAGKRLIASLEEAVKIAKGEQPAARIHHQGHSYVPEASTERIIAAAVHWRDSTYAIMPPARHHHVLFALHAQFPDDIIGPDEQGFVTSTGRFVERPEAKAIAVAAGQTTTTHSHLFSEDLW